MANFRNLLLLLLHTSSVFALTIDPSSSLLRQKSTNRTSPLELLEVAPQDGVLNTHLPAENLTQRSPPIQWEYIQDAYRVRLTRKPDSSRSRAQNPGVVLHNWALAVEEASSALEDQRVVAHLPWGARISGGSFICTATLRRQRPQERADMKRKLVFRISATNERDGLLYEEAWVVLKAYAEYRREWMTTPEGLSNDEVRMARLELLAQGFDDDVRFAYGGVDLIIPGHSGGLSDLSGVSRVSLSRDSS